MSTRYSPSTWTSTGGTAEYGTEWFYLRGEGYDGQGALFQTSNDSNNFAGQGRVMFEGPTTIGGDRSLEFRYGNISLNGCKMTVAMKGEKIFRLVSLGVDGCGDVEVVSGMFGVEAGTGNPNATSTFTINDGTEFRINNTTSEDKRALVFKAGAKFTVGQQGADGALDTVLDGKNRWSGPVTLESKVPVTFQSRAKLLQISGKIEGDGGIAATGGGHLRLGNVANTFRGGVSMVGVVGPGELNVTGGVAVVGSTTAASSADGIIPVDGGPISIKNARFAIVDNRKASLPDLVAEGRCIVTGGSMAAYKSYVQKGNDVVTMYGTQNILGSADIQSGTLCFATQVRPVGLNWYYYYGNSSSHPGTNTPNTGVPNWTPYLGVDSMGARYAYDNWKTTSGSDGATSHNQCHYYTGYIRVPGETGTSVECNFIVSVCRNVSVGIDGTTYVAKVSDNTDNLTGRTLSYKRCVVCPKVALTAGWHSIIIYMGNFWNSTCGPISCDNPTRGANFGIGVDWQGRCEAVAANYQKLIDPGDGSFLRPYLNDNDKATVDPKGYRPTFQSAVAFGPGTVLDIGDSVPYTPMVVPSLTGLPTIRNGAVQVTSSTWTIRKADLLDDNNAARNQPLTLGTGASLAFPAGQVTIDMPAADLEALAAYSKNAACPLIADISAFLGNTFVLSQDLESVKWSLGTENGTLSLVKRVGCAIIVR